MRNERLALIALRGSMRVDVVDMGEVHLESMRMAMARQQWPPKPGPNLLLFGEYNCLVHVE